MCYRNGVFPGPDLSFSLISQTVEYLFLKEVVDRHLSSIHGFKELQELEPVPVLGKGVVGTASNWLLSYLNTLLIDSVEISPESIEDVCCTSLSVLHKILPDKEPWPVLRGSPSPGDTYLRRLWRPFASCRPLRRSPTLRFPFVHRSRPCRSPRGDRWMTIAGKRWLWLERHAQVSSAVGLYSCPF